MTYKELLSFDTFNDRLSALMLQDKKYMSPRMSMREIYLSYEWVVFRKQILIRDNGCDLGIINFPIEGPMIVHHIDPITIDDILNNNYKKIFDENNVITCSINTHNVIHYRKKEETYCERKPGDTILW